MVPSVFMVIGPWGRENYEIARNYQNRGACDWIIQLNMVVGWLVFQSKGKFLSRSRHPGSTTAKEA
jgi:hypothetical protein